MKNKLEEAKTKVGFTYTDWKVFKRVWDKLTDDLNEINLLHYRVEYRPKFKFRFSVLETKESIEDKQELMFDIDLDTKEELLNALALIDEISKW